MVGHGFSLRSHGVPIFFPFLHAANPRPFYFAEVIATSGKMQLASQSKNPYVRLTKVQTTVTQNYETRGTQKVQLGVAGQTNSLLTQCKQQPGNNAPCCALYFFIRPYLSSVSKCALQLTCKEMGRLLDTPAAWATLDLRADVIGRRTMKSGRQSIMSREPLFFLARSVVQQVITASRYARILFCGKYGI